MKQAFLMEDSCRLIFFLAQISRSSNKALSTHVRTRQFRRLSPVRVIEMHCQPRQNAFVGITTGRQYLLFRGPDKAAKNVLCVLFDQRSRVLESVNSEFVPFFPSPLLPR